MENRLLEEEVTRAIIGAFRNVHRVLGFGYREYIYSLALERELVAKGHRVVDEKVVIENKTGERLDPNACTQLLSYLSSTNLEVGLVLHFARDPKLKRIICENRFKRRV